MIEALLVQVKAKRHELSFDTTQNHADFSLSVMM
jgi:hypothetical protein